MNVLRTSGDGTVALDSLEPSPPAAGEVAIDVLAATVNAVDIAVVDGVVRELGVSKSTEPVGLGWDLVGRVTARGAGVALAIGSVVAAVRVGVDAPRGALADRVVVAARDCALVPPGLDPLDAAVIGMNALTAAQALQVVGPPAGRSLLVTGGAGGVGGFAVELAAHSGFDVHGLARPSDQEFLDRVGARRIDALDATTFDVVLDAAPLQYDAIRFASELLPTVAGGGDFIGVMGWLPTPQLPGRHVHTVFVEPDGAELGRLLDLAGRGVITPRTAGRVPLTEASTAIDRVRRGGHRGRWVVQPS